MHPQPTPDHLWLKKLVGEWTTESECDMGPDKPRETMRGREIVRAVGDLWVVCEGTGSVPGGGTMTSMMTLGFDPAKGVYRGTWIGSPMTHLWVYTATRSGDVLPLEAEGPDFSDPTKTQMYQDVIEFQGDDKRTLTARMPDGNGGWKEFMQSTYIRVK